MAQSRSNTLGFPVACTYPLKPGVFLANIRSTSESVAPPNPSASSPFNSRKLNQRDIISPAVEVSPSGTISVSEAAGFGYEIDLDYLRHVTVREETLA